MATELRAVDPQAFYKYFLDKNIRPDSRELLKARSTSISVDCVRSADGSALVKIGNTTVICGIKAEISNSAPSEPLKGFIVPNVELPPLCSARFRPGPPSEQAQIYTQFIADTISNSSCIKAEDLNIVAGKIAWCLFIDIICLSYDGNILDAALLALLGALHTTKLPNVVVKSDGAEQISVEETTKPLKVYSEPISSTFAIIADGKIILDPNDEEEEISKGTITIVFDNEQLCGIHKASGVSISEEQMNECISNAKSRSKNLREMLQQSLHSLQ